MKRALFLITVFALFALAASGQSAVSAVAADGMTDKAVDKAKGFSLPDTNGKMRSINDLQGKNGSVVVFLSAQCPVVKGYNARINQIAADYAAKGINFIGINSNSTESLDWVKSHAAENYKFPMLIDKGNVVADKLGATVTPEVFYYDANETLIYRGAIDNDRSGQNVTTPYLRSAFDLSLAGKPVERASANAFGCSIKRVE